MSVQRNIWEGFRVWLRSLVELLPQLFELWPTLKRIFESLCRWIREWRTHRRGGCCIDIPASEYKRPDPLLYAQFFLMQQGLAVTWDNPDIQLYDGSLPVSSSSLVPDHDYDVVVRVWNNSYYAPAASLPVYLSFLDFGVGMTSNPIGKTYVDLGVKGSSHCPAFAKIKWHTPKVSGHYCLQAILDWPDDANPDNNLGQENTNVGTMHSPAAFTFQVRNDATITRNFELETDMYRLPKPKQCPPQDGIAKGRDKRTSRLKESRMRWNKALEEQGHVLFPVTPEWKVKIEPETFTLNANQVITVKVEIEYKKGEFSGRRPFNINCFASGPHQKRKLTGGVTLIVEGGA